MKKFLSWLTFITPAAYNLRRHPERNAPRVAWIKRLIAGEYAPQGLLDRYCGPRFGK